MTATFVSSCPRCGADKITFDIKAQQYRFTRYDWQRFHETFCICRSCLKSTVFVLGLTEYDAKATFDKENGIVSYNGDITRFFQNDGYVSLKDNRGVSPPEHLTEEVLAAFNEGAACIAIGANNAATSMFRLCLDLVTKPLLPPIDETSLKQPNAKQRRDLGLRLAWLFDEGILPTPLRELSRSIREDANDGVHAGNLSKEDAEDVLDFTIALLDRLVSEPMRIQRAEERRLARRERK